MKLPKKIPYGISNYKSLRTENYAYVDKTHFIEMLENENTKYQFLIRPRKFGKSLFLSVLRHYYDICSADDFDVLFGDLYIGKNPTFKRNSYFVLRFSFSGFDTSSVEDFRVSFNSNIEASVKEFFNHYQDFINADYYKKIEMQLIDERGKIGVKAIANNVFDIVRKNKGKLYVIIDEYDHFANDLIAQGTNLSMEQYKELIWANGVVRDFYETLKDNTETVIDNIFITGITPIMLDDITSGFNISNNLSTDVRYSEILGFTEEEIEFLLDECGIDRTKITVDRKFLYNGYLFHKKAKNRLYNSAMMLYFLDKISSTEGEVEELIDDNLKTDYGRVKVLLSKAENIENLEKIIEYTKISAKIISRFSIDRIHDSENFLSLLYYMGLLTIDKDLETYTALLCIPNYSIKTMYWEHIRTILKTQNPQLSHNEINLSQSLKDLAFKNKPEEFIKFMQEFYVSRFSNRDFQRFDEKYIKAVMLTLIFQENYYLPISEFETSEGYLDIYLQRRINLYPTVKNDWVWELKYIKEADAKKATVVEAKKKEAIAQLQRYKSSNYFKDRTDVRYLAVVFVGKKKYFVQEVE